MISIEDLAESLGTFDIEIAGKTVKAKRLSAYDRRQARAHAPVPVPPLTKKDPTKGSLAPPLPDENDPGFRADFLKWSYRVQAIEIAIALGLKLPGGLEWGPGLIGGGQVAAFAEAACTAIEQAWSSETIERVHKAINEAPTPQDVALGNSSGSTSGD